MQLITNPTSGSYSRARVARLAQSLEAEGATVLHCESAGEPRFAATATHVCVVGGDGTVRRVAGAMARQERAVPLSIYPSGTINLLAREAEYPADPRAFARLVLAGRAGRPHYPVALGDGFFFSCAGVGPDSCAVERVSLPLKRWIGRLAYGAAFCQLLWHWSRHTIRLESEGRVLECEAFYVAKGRYYAGAWSLAQSARVHDPLFHVIALPTARRRDYARFVFGLICGRDASRQAGVETFTCRALSATSEAGLPIQADGDIVGRLPVTMNVGEVPLTFC
ncbi:hypothetical protein KK137_13455 [Croceibacterium sp. LX-88]|uniref:DAGKc domain-containing protein n=1 Tax=Croceibacterium selenioxidans TaxID=2838833 RepID=A0ABS5WAA2_9SPHN|nr:hypothetical protein [Croceibacterium selenioxidans]